MIYFLCINGNPEALRGLAVCHRHRSHWDFNADQGLWTVTPQISLPSQSRWRGESETLSGSACRRSSCGKVTSDGHPAELHFQLRNIGLGACNVFYHMEL